jgi:hypothetical protein
MGDIKMTTTRGYAHYAGLLPVEPSDEPPPLRPTILENPFPDGQPSLRKRALRALSRFLIAFCTGVAAILAWQSYGDAAKEMIASSYPQLSWLAPQARPIAHSAPNIALPAPAAPSFDHQQLSAMSLDLNAVRESVDRIDTRMTAGHELILRSIDQIATRTTAGQERMTPSTDQTDTNIGAGQKQIAGSIDQTATNSAQAPPARAPAAPPPPAVSYTQRRAWYSYVPSTRRNIHRNLLMGSDGTYKVVATDHNAAGNSNGGSICIFNAGGWSDCVSNAGDRYQLKPASIRWFVNIANGAAP